MAQLSIVAKIEAYNAIPNRGIIHFGYEGIARKVEAGWLNKAATFKVIKTGPLTETRRGTLTFQGVVVDSSIVYMLNGKQITKEEWYKAAGIENVNTQQSVLCTFSLHKCLGISQA